MAKHKVDMDGYTESEGYSGKEPTRGLYDGKLVKVEDHDVAGSDGLHWTFEITKGEFSGWRGHIYSNFETVLWKTQQCVHAITGAKKGITINTDDDGAALAKKAHPVSMRIVQEKYEGEMRGRLRAVMVKSDDDDDADDNDGDDSDGDNEADPFA